MKQNPSSSGEYSVVIIEYFSGDHLMRCLETLRLQTHQPEKIVVVINGIDENKRKDLENDFVEVQIIDAHANLGYARAANLGIANTTSPIVLTLNPDTEVGPDAAKIACEYMIHNSGVGTVGPRIYESDGSIYPSARLEPSMFLAFAHAVLSPIFPNNRFTQKYKNVDLDHDEIHSVDWLSGAALFIDRDALDDVGGWDEDYFMYCEDIDLGRKMRMNRWKNVFVPTATIMHVQGVSTSRAPISLLIHHHRSLYVYSSKKYKNNPAMKVFVAVFILLRLPLALAARILRIN